MEVVVVDTVDIEIVEGGGGGLEIDRDCLSEYSSNLGVISDCPRSTTGRLKSISSFVSSSVVGYQLWLWFASSCYLGYSVVEVGSYMQWPDTLLCWISLRVVIDVVVKWHPADLGLGEFSKCNSASWLRRRNEFVHWETKREILANDEHMLGLKAARYNKAA